jgi:phosphocarrier protein HPr
MSEVAEGEFEIVNALGLHARAAAQLVKVANRYKSEVWVSCEGQRVNGKSIMGVLMLAAGQGMRVSVQCAGEDAASCLAEVGQLIANKFGEAH